MVVVRNLGAKVGIGLFLLIESAEAGELLEPRRVAVPIVGSHPDNVGSATALTHIGDSSLQTVGKVRKILAYTVTLRPVFGLHVHNQ